MVPFADLQQRKGACMHPAVEVMNKSVVGLRVSSQPQYEAGPFSLSAGQYGRLYPQTTLCFCPSALITLRRRAADSLNMAAACFTLINADDKRAATRVFFFFFLISRHVGARTFIYIIICTSTDRAFSGQLPLTLPCQTVTHAPPPPPPPPFFFFCDGPSVVTSPSLASQINTELFWVV